MNKPSLLNHLLKVTMVVVVVVLLFNLLLNTIDNLNRAGKDARAVTADVAASMVPLLKNTLIVGDLDTIQQTLDALMLQEHFRRLYLLDAKGADVLIEGRQGNAAVSRVPEWFRRLVTIRFDQQHFPIVVGGTSYATLVADPSPDRAVAAIWHSTLVALGLATMSLLAIAIILTLFLRRGLRPLDSLTMAARRLGNGDFSHRAPLSDMHELAETAQAFNQMADKLIEARDHLESRVNERTAQLMESTQRLEESEERFRIQFEHAPEAILVLDRINGKVIDANPNAEHMFGLEHSVMCSQTLISLSPERQTDDSESAHGKLSDLGAALARGEEVFEWSFRHASGRLIACEVRLVTLPSADRRQVRASITDISQRKEAEEKLRLYASAFSQSGEAILITNRKNRIIAINPALTRHTGYTLEELLDQDPRVLGSGLTPRKTYEEMWKSLELRGHWQGELLDLDRHGRTFPKWTNISVIRDDQGQITHYLASYTDITERKAAEARIYQLAHHDSLTGLVNRYCLDDRLEQALLSARRKSERMGIMFIDMDRFKLINDTLGHHVGDLLLKEVARRLQSCVRESDIVARIGGDEFVVVLTSISASLEAAKIGEKIRHLLAEPYQIEGNTLHSSPSVGISVFPTDGADKKTLMQNADMAMYHAKDAGRNNVQFFTSEMNAAVTERLELEVELRAALTDKQFVLHYQPLVEAATRRICGIEVLVRWQHPKRGLVPPLKFIPIAEEIGLIEPLGDWVLDTACGQLAAWQRQGIAGLCLAVNISTHQFRSQTLVSTVRSALERHGLDAGNLELEITESAAMADPERAIGQMHALRAMNVGLAIDDFGTGYSSLAYLQLLPIQTLKLDRAFVQDLTTDEKDAGICSASLLLAHSLGLKVVAEGIETDAQCQYLVAHECDYLQGYLFSKPLPADEITPLLVKGTV